MSDDKKGVIDFKKFKEDRDAAKTLIDNDNKTDGLLALIELMEKQDELVQMLIHDVLTLSDELQKQRAMALNIGSSLSAVTMALEQEGVIKIATIQEVWERELKPQLDKLDQATKAVATEKSRIIMPGSPKIVVP